MTADFVRARLRSVAFTSLRMKRLSGLQPQCLFWWGFEFTQRPLKGLKTFKKAFYKPNEKACIVLQFNKDSDPQVMCFHLFVKDVEGFFWERPGKGTKSREWGGGLRRQWRLQSRGREGTEWTVCSVTQQHLAEILGLKKPFPALTLLLSPSTGWQKYKMLWCFDWTKETRVSTPVSCLYLLADRWWEDQVSVSWCAPAVSFGSLPK